MPEFIVEIPEFVNCFAPQWMQAEYRLSVELHSNAIVIMGDANGLKNLAIQLLSQRFLNPLRRFSSPFLQETLSCSYSLRSEIINNF
jgi:hypothetical protein